MSAMRFRYRRGLSGHGGYRGKERLYRDRSRASRWQAQQLIDEYLDSEDESVCRVRIGHRSEFIPTAAETEDEVEARQEQLSLPLDEQRRVMNAAEEPGQEPVLRLHAPEPRAADINEMVETPVQENAKEDARCAAMKSAAAPERPQRTPYEWFADRRPVRAKSFQRGHFLYGCALGTAAAAAILAMLRVAFM